MLVGHLALLLVFDLGTRPFLTVALCLGNFFAYLYAAKSLDGLAIDPKKVFGVAILLRILLLPLPPSLSDDSLRYVWDGHVVRAGFNPFLVAPEALELESLRRQGVTAEIWKELPHRDVPTVYPPLAQGLFTLASWLPLPLIGVKILLCFADLLSCWAFFRLAALLGKARGRVVWYAWHPLLTLEVAGMGHVDALMVAAVLATVWLLVAPAERDRTVAAGFFAAAAVLAKLIPLIAWPLWARSSRRPLLFLLIASVVTVAACWPFFAHGTPGLLRYGVTWEFNGPLYEPLWRTIAALDPVPAIKSGLDLLKTLTGRHDQLNRVYPLVYPQLLAKLLLLSLFGALCLRIWWRRPPVLVATEQVFGAFVLCSATFYPWYALIILPFAALERSAPWLTLSALLPLAYLSQKVPGLAHFPWIYLLIWMPPFLLLLKSWSRRTLTES